MKIFKNDKSNRGPQTKETVLCLGAYNTVRITKRNITAIILYGLWSPDKEMTGAALHNFSKDVFNVYVHRNASILDTRDCSPAKMFIRSEEIGSFKREKFHFNSVEAVNHYWSGAFSKTR